MNRTKHQNRCFVFLVAKTLVQWCWDFVSSAVIFAFSLHVGVNMGISASNPINKILSPEPMGILALDMAVHAAVGAGAAATLLAINPIVGAMFGAFYLAGSQAAHIVVQLLENNVGGEFRSQTAFAKAMKFALTFFGGIVLASAACTFLGAPIVFSVGVGLTVAMFATTSAIATFVFSSASRDVIIGPNLLSQRV
jgi:uncharacterized protein (DUF697 family)